MSNATERANSHAGFHNGDFKVFWIADPVSIWFDEGWYWKDKDKLFAGPFETSQEAFGNYKDRIDQAG